MVDALQTVDGVGLARPVCLEPELPRQILAGEVHAAINQLTDDNDFGATNVAAGTQIRQLGKDERPIDLASVGVFRGTMHARDLANRKCCRGISNASGHPAGRSRGM